MDDKHIHFTVLSECACELTSPIHAQIDSKELVYRRVAQASTNKKHYIVYNVGFLKEKKLLELVSPLMATQKKSQSSWVRGRPHWKITSK